jgi:hypothetical protein
MGIVVTFGLGLFAVSTGLATTPQIGYLWSFEELTSKADLVVIAESIRTEVTGRRTAHPELRPDLPVAELVTTLKVLAVLKPDPRAASAGMSQVRLKHYRIDRNELLRRHPPQPGLPPSGLVNAGSYLDFSADTGPYLVFLTRSAGDTYEPLSGHTFPTDSVYRLSKAGRQRG